MRILLLQSCCRQIPIATWAAKSSSTQKCFHGSTILPRSASLIQNSWLLLRSSQVRFRLEFWGLRSPYVNLCIQQRRISGAQLDLEARIVHAWRIRTKSLQKWLDLCKHYRRTWLAVCSTIPSRCVIYDPWTWNYVVGTVGTGMEIDSYDEMA